MSKRRSAYPPEFRRQMVSGRAAIPKSCRGSLSRRRRRSATGWRRRTEMNREYRCYVGLPKLPFRRVG
jgi:hypothetical protein